MGVEEHQLVRIRVLPTSVVGVAAGVSTAVIGPRLRA
jgi:hypothetical protein